MTRTRAVLFLVLLLPSVLGGAALAQETWPEEDDLLAPEQLVGAPAGPALSGDALEAAAAEVSSVLRCPVCQGLSVADSPATMALNMKSQVRDMVARGYTEEQILTYYELSYGEFVRLEPPLRGVNWLVWVAPLGALVLGGLVVARTLKARGGTEEAEPLPDALPGRGTLPDDPELAPYVRRARELAYGWPDGTPPEEESR